MRSSEWRPDRVDQRLRDILDAIGRIERYVIGVSREQFLHEEILRDAVARQILIIAEATDKLFELEREQSIETGRGLAHRCPNVPWRSIRDMGIRVRHVYGREDPEEIWLVVDGEDLHELRAALVLGYPELNLG